MKYETYETAVLINAALDDDQIEAEISRIREQIQNYGGEITDFENWGRKRLAYMVEKSKIGYYVIFRFTAPATLISKLERFYNLNREVILRFLMIKLDKDALEYIEQKRVSSIESEPSVTEPAEIIGAPEVPAPEVQPADSKENEQ
jgi:small subunit ribosomal protein S6